MNKVTEIIKQLRAMLENGIDKGRMVYIKPDAKAITGSWPSAMFWNDEMSSMVGGIFLKKGGTDYNTTVIVWENIGPKNYSFPRDAVIILTKKKTKKLLKKLRDELVACNRPYVQQVGRALRCPGVKSFVIRPYQQVLIDEIMSQFVKHSSRADVRVYVKKDATCPKDGFGWSIEPSMLGGIYHLAKPLSARQELEKKKDVVYLQSNSGHITVFNRSDVVVVEGELS